MFVGGSRYSSAGKGLADAVAKVFGRRLWQSLSFDEYSLDLVEEIVGPHEFEDADLGETQEEVGDRNRIERGGVGEDSVSLSGWH